MTSPAWVQVMQQQCDWDITSMQLQLFADTVGVQGGVVARSGPAAGGRGGRAVPAQPRAAPRAPAACRSRRGAELAARGAQPSPSP